MKERGSGKEIKEKRDLLLKRGWVEVQDFREGGRFSKYAEFDGRSRLLHVFYNGGSTAGDEYGTFLVWDSSPFKGQSKIGDDQELRTALELWRREGWKVIKMGAIIDIPSQGEGEEIRYNKLVAIRRKENDFSGNPSPSGDERKKMGRPITPRSR